MLKRGSGRMWWLVPLFGALAVGCASAQDVGSTSLPELTVTRPAKADEVVWLKIRVGVLPKGTELRVSTPQGNLLGTVSPFGAASGQPAGTYTIALPSGSLENGRLRLRIDVDAPGRVTRPATTKDVDGMELVLIPVTR